MFTENQLVGALKSKDNRAFVYLYDHYARTLNGYIRKKIKDDELVNDILQQTFINIWRKIDTYNPEKGRLFTWMLKIANNISIDHIRSKAYRNNLKNYRLTDLVPVCSIIRNIYSIDAIGIEEIICILKPSERILIDMVYFKGYTHEEISKLLNIPLGTVKTRIRRGLIFLRKYYTYDDQQRRNIA